jgi:hypothetical protein
MPSLNCTLPTGVADVLVFCTVAVRLTPSPHTAVVVEGVTAVEVASAAEAPGTPTDRLAARAASAVSEPAMERCLGMRSPFRVAAPPH